MRAYFETDGGPHGGPGTLRPTEAPPPDAGDDDED